MYKSDGQSALTNIFGVIVLVVLTFLLQAAFSLPRIVLMVGALTTFWNQTKSPEPLHEILYESFDFLFALVSGFLSMAGCRLLVPSANRLTIIFGAATTIFLYSILTIFVQGHVPAYFFPIYLDLSAAIPGWLIGFYFAGGRDVWTKFRVSGFAAIFAPAAIVITAVVLAPWYIPFYMPIPYVKPPTAVPDSFHYVPSEQNSAASFTPPMPKNQWSDVPSFHTVGPNGQ